jgi:ABC-type nitrate/sulfonate/bicarbonate transport system substrate-binding protein
MATAKKPAAKKASKSRATKAKKTKATGARKKTTIEVSRSTSGSGETAAPSVEALLGMVLEAAREGTVGEQLQTIANSLVEKSGDQPAKSKQPSRKAPPKKLKVTTLKNTKLSKVKLNWKEVWYTNCPLVSASNVDQELGWTREEYKKIGVKYAFMRSTPDNDWYPHYIHNLDNLIRFGGLFPPVAVHADVRRTRLLGVTHAPHEGGCMLVRARDDIYTMADLKGKKIGLSKSLNTIKNDWWRIQEHQGIELMLRINGMTMDDVEIVEFPYEDAWYNDPAMVGPPMENPSELWLKRDHKHDLAFRPLEPALEKGVVDAIYTQSKVFQHLQEATGKFKAIEDLSRYPDWTLQVANIPAAITCTDVMAEKHPELVVTFMKGMIKVGRWANEHKHAAAVILDKQTFYLDVEDTYEGIKHIDMVPNLSPQNLASVEIGKDFMLSHGYIKKDFDVQKWAAPEFLEQASKELLEQEWEKRTAAKLPRATELLAATRRVG